MKEMMIRKRLKIKELWQSDHATWIGRERADGSAPPGTIHLGAYTIHFKRKEIGSFDVYAVKDGIIKAKMYVSPEDIWEGKRGKRIEDEKKKKHKEWLEVTRIRLESVKEITCPLIGAHHLSACSGCKYCKTQTDYFIDCSYTNVRCDPSGSCGIMRVRNV